MTWSLRARRSSQSSEVAIEDEQRSQTYAIIGFAGATGRTSTVKELGFQFSDQGNRACVMDADLVSPTLTRELRAFENVDLLDRLRTIHHATESNLLDIPMTSSGLSIVPGLRQAHRWLDVLPTAFAVTLDQVQELYTRVMIDVCAGVEPMSSSNERSVKNSSTHSPHRLRDPKQLAHLVIERADCVVLTTRPDDISLTRLIDGFSRRQHLFVDKQLHIAVTQVLNSREEKECRTTIQRLLGINAISFIPNDPELYRQAIRAGVSVGEFKPRSSVASAYFELAESIQSNKESTLATTRMTSVLRRAS